MKSEKVALIERKNETGLGRLVADMLDNVKGNGSGGLEGKGRSQNLPGCPFESNKESWSREKGLSCSPKNVA